MSSIPFNYAQPLGNEMRYIEEAITSGRIMGDGIFAKRCEALLQEYTQVQRALLTTSCTSALEMAALLLDIKRGDEVIVPSFAFVSTANAFVLHGATCVFSDIRPDTLNLDESRLRSLVTERTRAIVPLHYAGIACEMTFIHQIAQEYGLTVIEDNAHGLSGAYQGKPLGSFGHLAALSFHETKNYTCGEGGALLINDERYVERAEILREKGTDRKKFFRGEIDKYSWVDLGSSYVPSEILAAMLLAQLECFEWIHGKRRTLWERYQKGLGEWAKQQGVQMPVVPESCQPAYHIFYLLLPSERERNNFIAHLRAANIGVVFHYLPLHLSKMGQRWFGGKKGDCPIAEDVSARLVRLPLYCGLNEIDQERVIDTIIRISF